MKTQNVVLGIIAIILIVGGFIYFQASFTNTEIKVDVPESSQSQVLYDRMQYIDYSKQNFTNAQKEGRTLLFFAATTWCSNCIQLEKQIILHINELPKDITILKVDYDNDKETKAKYAVTQQTTLVLLDENGKEIKRWIGTGEFADLMQNII